MAAERSVAAELESDLAAERSAAEELKGQLSETEAALLIATSTTTIPIRSVSLWVGVYDSWQRIGDTGCVTTRRPVDYRYIQENRQLLVFDAGSNALVAAKGIGDGTVTTDSGGFDYCRFEAVVELVLDAEVYRLVVEGSRDDGIAYPISEIRSRGYEIGIIYYDQAAEEARERQRQSG